VLERFAVGWFCAYITRLMRQFPLKYEGQRELLYYPERPESFAGEILEIGPGRGDLLLSLAQNMPATRFVAIELGKKRYWKLIPRIEKLGLENILLIKGDARVALPRHFEDGTFHRIYVLFPDPWPKKRHEPNRLMQPEFMSLLAAKLMKGGELFFATDVQIYVQWVQENVSEVATLERVAGPSTDRPQIAEYMPTYFEQKWRADDRDIYYMLMRRV
jgi:tRNA (guanine-N7-)-methyltransferase